MFDQQTNSTPTTEVALPEANASVAVPETPVAAVPTPPTDVQPVVVDDTNGVEPRNQRVEAGRKGAQRVHQLIREGKLYETEHGLKSGRQRLRQLLELGKLYEQEHGSRPVKQKRRERLTRSDREELLTTFLRCVLRLAKPSFREELVELIGKLQKEKPGQAP